MKINLFSSVVCAFLFYSINGAIIDEKEIFERFSTNLLKLKEFIAKSKAEYDKTTNNTSVFQGIKRFRLRGYDGLILIDDNDTPPNPLFNITSYAVNDQNYKQEISISDNVKRKLLRIGSVTRCMSPALAYDSWREKASSYFSAWYDDIEHTEIENNTYSTSYSVTDGGLSELVFQMPPFKVNVSPLSKVKVTSDFYSYVSNILYSVEAVLHIRSEDFETSVEQSDDAVKVAALEFFGSEYWKNLDRGSYERWIPNIIINDSIKWIKFSKFPLVVKRTRLDLIRNIGEDEPL